MSDDRGCSRCTCTALLETVLFHQRYFFECALWKVALYSIIQQIFIDLFHCFSLCEMIAPDVLFNYIPRRQVILTSSIAFLSHRPCSFLHCQIPSQGQKGYSASGSSDQAQDQGKEVAARLVRAEGWRRRQESSRRTALLRHRGERVRKEFGEERSGSGQHTCALSKS